jgi:uncharacterized Zn finger protein
MARARLHIICGNCGCNNEFTYDIVNDMYDYGEYQEAGVQIWCNNCGTLHDLGDNAEKQ